MEIKPIVRLIDDDLEYLESEAYLLRKLGYSVISYAGAQDFLENGDSDSPGCAVIDIKMPQIDGLQLQRILREREIFLPIIFLTGHGEIDMAVYAVQNGAVGFLQKPIDAEALGKHIEKAFEIDDRARSSAKNIEEAKNRFNLLTLREKEVCALLVKGFLNKQIAYELGISEHTVKVHRASARNKMKIRTPIEFVKLMEKVGLLKE